ncbi:hypothetical protein [Streptomyces lavendofoliae]|uniref:hypothetical protein n=1 Tax=Streptomyces lavendofoliae TaxID=67314 RepID=UPI003D907311
MRPATGHRPLATGHRARGPHHRGARTGGEVNPGHNQRDRQLVRRPLHRTRPPGTPLARHAGAAPRHTAAHLPAALEHEPARPQRRDTGKRVAAEFIVAVAAGLAADLLFMPAFLLTAAAAWMPAAPF